MADPRFFDRQGPFALRDIAVATGAALPEKCDLGSIFDDVAPLDRAGPAQVSFFDNPKYANDFARCKAGACFVREELVGSAPSTMATLVTSAPYLAFARTAALFYPDAGSTWIGEGSIDPSARIGIGCRIASTVTIGPGADIGDETQIGHGCHIGRGVILGARCVLHPGITITHAIIGDDAVILPGARIGQEGFGFAPDLSGYLPVPQLGRVMIGHRVAIGANTTIDRGAGPDTVIGDDCCIDNLVQIAHNVELGRGCLVVSQVGFSGSTKLGDYVVMGGQTGFAGHLSVASGITLAARTGVTHDLRQPGEYGGFPAVPIREWRKQIATLKRFAKKRNGNDG